MKRDTISVKYGLLILFVFFGWVSQRQEAIAQISFRAASSAASGSTSSFTINKPSGVVESDLLIAQVTVNNGNDTSITSPRSR